MNEREREIAIKIWPHLMRNEPPIVPVPYADRVETAKRQMGDAYLCARPINRRGQS